MPQSDTQPVDTQLADAQQDVALSDAVAADRIAAAQRYGDFDNLDFGQKNEKHTMREEVLDTVATINYEDRKEFGHDIDNMLLSCSWSGFPCGPA